MRNIALKLMYNGTAYHGWQVQKNAVTVCETLQKALKQITGEDVHLTGCGRTDAGVHAEHYVANFRTESRIPLERLPFAFAFKGVSILLNAPMIYWVMVLSLAS